MKIVLLSGGSSIHTVRWANGLSEVGNEVHVITQHAPSESFNEHVVVHQFPYLGVLGYFTMVPRIRRLLKRIQPDLVNAHYASGYGTTARLVGFHPWLMSVWGSDVYDFPYKSPLHGWLVRKNLLAADRVASTSFCMAKQTRQIVPSVANIAITPFGVDISAYQQVPPLSSMSQEYIVIGTVKTMADQYGIDTLIEAFAMLKKRLYTSNSMSVNLKMRLVGDGPQTEALQDLAENLGVAEFITFVGKVPHAQVPGELAKIDIYAALSRIESFGVAILEAGAAGRPVVVSDTGGLPEVTVDGITGFVVPSENPQAAANMLERLVMDAELRYCMGVAGKKHVTNNYSWDTCIQTMLTEYRKTIEILK